MVQLALSPKQSQLLERDRAILQAARGLVLQYGYFGVTMDSIAKASELPKGTVYHRFGCKEEILVALATDCVSRRNEMMQRGASFKGRPRERFLAMAEGVSLYSRLSPEDSAVLRSTLGPVREKASPMRLAALMEAEKEALAIVGKILQDAIRAGDLELESEDLIGEMAFGSWALVEGGFSLITSGSPQQALALERPLHHLWMYFNRSADAYGWRPLFDEWDYFESLANIRRQRFPDEAQQLYGEGEWYGDMA